jgi:hypothetical protein
VHWCLRQLAWLPIYTLVWRWSASMRVAGYLGWGAPHEKSVIETKSSLLVLWILVWMNPSLLTANNSC